MATAPDNWEAVQQLFEPALEQDSERRSLFLQERCTDPAVRAEVERLLAEHDQVGSFLSTPVPQNLAPENEITTDTLRISPGVVLSGRFRIVRFIACGGMGDVYEAEDE